MPLEVYPPLSDGWALDLINSIKDMQSRLATIEQAMGEFMSSVAGDYSTIDSRITLLEDAGFQAQIDDLQSQIDAL